MADDLMSGQTVGIRFRGEARLTYCCAENDIRVGDWVIVQGPEGERQGCVVLCEEQLVLAETEPQLAHVLRKIAATDMLAETGDPQPARSISPENQIGFGGPGHPAIGKQPETRSSFEDDTYRALKSQFPRLGDLVLTDGGEMLVVGVNIRTSTFAVRQSVDAETLTISVQDVLAQSDCVDR